MRESNKLAFPLQLFFESTSSSHFGDWSCFCLASTCYLPNPYYFLITESAGFHSTLCTSEKSPNVFIMTLSPSYLFLSGFYFWSSLFCLQCTSPPFNLISPSEHGWLPAHSGLWVYMCVRTCVCTCIFDVWCKMYLSGQLFIWKHTCIVSSKG